jgi:hypothetical protein
MIFICSRHQSCDGQQREGNVKRFLAAGAVALLPQFATAETAQETAARDAVTSCMYFYGMNNVGYEFSAADTRKVVIDVCKGQIAKYNTLMNPEQKLAYGSSGQTAGTDYAKILLDLFIKDYTKALSVVKQK